jgi:Periplasmic copper-binding protein (NosD)
MPTDPLPAYSSDHAAHTHVNKPAIDRSSLGKRRAGWSRRMRIGYIGTRSSTRTAAGVAVALLLISGAFLTAFALLPTETGAYSTRNAISIIGDGAFLPENGVVSGSGSSEDPYMISEWEIQVSSGSAITIRNTTASFVIDEVHLNGTATYSDMIYCIYLYNVSNGRIKSSLLNNTNVGVYMAECVNCSVQQNSLLSINQVAIAVTDCVQTNIVGNIILGAGGIDADGWDDSAICLNYFQYCEMALMTWQGDNLSITQNYFDSCQYCIYLITSQWSTIHGNAGIGCWYGVKVSMCFNCSVVANTFALMTATGINVNNFSFDVLVAYNQLMACEYGSVWVDNANNVIIRDNILENGEMTYDPYGGGVFLDTNGNVSVYHNNIINNIDLQAEDYMGSENRWNDSYPSGGNWWSDYAGVDLNDGPNQDNPGVSDGIGDAPYVLDADSRDNYPLMSMWYVNSRPIADFSVTPSGGDTMTLFELNGSASQDPDSSVGDSIQKFRWDLDGDGNWDTDWSTENVTSAMYPSPGNCTVILEVVDSNGLVSLYAVEFTVTEYGIPELGSLTLSLVSVMMIAAVFALRRRLSASK